LRRDGSSFHLELHASRVDCRGRPALAGVAIDVTELVRQQEELRRSHEQLRELAQRLNLAREVERQWLAREVHDVLGGMLTSVKFDLARIVRRAAGPGQEELHRIALDLVELVQETIATARSISERMRPASLELFGLAEALRQALERFGARHGVTIGIDGVDRLPALPDATAMQVYRIVQEGLTNVARHAHASQVTLTLREHDGEFELRLADNGRGLGDAPPRPGSIGLFSMSERAREIGGRLAVATRPEGGTEVLLHLPAPAAQAS
jgi:signal transduction histidine kinase